MLRLSFRLSFMFMLLKSSFLFAFSPFSITGNVVNEQGLALENVYIIVNNVKTKTNNLGQFTLNVPINDIYQLKLSKGGYYRALQTFSHFELQQQSAKIADITLVQKADNRIMLAFGGDVMMGRRYYKPYFGDEVLIHPENKLSDSKSIVRYIKPYMSIADYALVNLETQIADMKPAERAPKSVTFFSQPETLAALAWAGVDYVSLGNNHTYDYMDSGLESTLAYLNESALAYSGAGKNQASALKAHKTTVNNTNLAMLGYVGWEGSGNPTQTANSQHGGAAYGSMDNILTSVTKQVTKDYVTIVQYHGSQEYANNPTGVTEQRLKSALDAGASLAIAHHPHVAQGIELYNNKLIAYSMGNFIFDQNFSATQHSLILYVWLDDGKFHRAEIVPLYVKGYKPTPATGMHRYTVMKRLTELSKQRNTLISHSGGHGVIRIDEQANSNHKSNNKTHFAITFAEDEKVTPLYQLPWHQSLKAVMMPNKESRYRLGTNLINGSDFESFATFNSPERGWVFDRLTTKLNNFGASGQRSLGITLQKNIISTFGMQSFKRVYNPSSAMTVKGKFSTNKAVKITFYWQGRKKRQKLFDAFNNGKKHHIETVNLKGQSGWQNIEVNFNSPRVGYKSYRVIAEIQLQNGESSSLNIDDFALIEWQSAYSKNQIPNLYNTLSHQAAYIGVDTHVTAPIIVKF
ncbi:MAG: CapA family protein [Litorilituus sp.]|nr:CapA family protein [Litorilituus sp.]